MTLSESRAGRGLRALMPPSTGSYTTVQAVGHTVNVISVAVDGAVGGW